MAKVTMPLMSGDASGKFGKALVFSKWKGQKYVRQLVTPSNPQSADQGDARIIAGGTGRAAGKVMPLMAYDNELIALGVIPSGQSKQSYLVKYIIDHYFTTTGAIDSTKYAAELAALGSHGAKTSFESGADDLGITEFDLSYAAIAAYNKALGLYMLAKTALALGFTGAPYTTALASWTKTQVDAFVADFRTV